MTRLLAIDPTTYSPSPLHGSDRAWQETNCYVDLWVEALHALDLDPIPALTFTVSADFDGEQWLFIKFPLEDLRQLYGIDVAEMNPWRGIEHHTREQLELGRWITTEVDSWFLPDTAGVSYQLEHVKTSIIPNMIDVEGQRVGYFHGAGYFEADGEDYRGLMQRDRDGSNAMPPYVELVRFDHLVRPTDDELLATVVELVRKHLARRPETNPVSRMAKRVAEDVDWLKSEGVDLFHAYSFATLRQCGSTAELAASLCTWLDDRGLGTSESAAAFGEVATTSKAIQFKLARLAAGRDVDVAVLVEAMAIDWESAMSNLNQRLA
jgi:hypothetical protein